MDVEFGQQVIELEDKAYFSVAYAILGPFGELGHFAAVKVQLAGVGLVEQAHDV